MDSEELFNEYIMPYEELTRYLIKKYGKAEYDYYTDPSCTKRNPNVSRISEGLFCHHIDEDKGFNLGESSCAKLQSFEWQKKSRLVYCNILEHLLLHIKISIMSTSNQKQVSPLPGVYFLSHHLNDIYMSDGEMCKWGVKCEELVSDNYSDYIRIICIFFAYIEESFEGNQEELLEHIGAILEKICGGDNTLCYQQVYSDVCEYELNKIDKDVLEKISYYELFDSRFAVIDIETTFSGETMSIGVVIAKKDSFEIVDARYYVVKPACDHHAIYRRQLYLPEADIFLKSSRKIIVEDLNHFLIKNGIKRIFAYNGGFDRNCLPELAQYDWYDIVRIAAYIQYNPMIPKDTECHGTGRMKSGYAVEDMMLILTGDDSYKESHNAYFDAIDELEIMRLLGKKIDEYAVALL